jgi:sugar phosphate isomerase/epimerase
MNRRELFALPALALPAWGAPPVGMSRIAVITDEASASPAEAVAFCQKHGLKWMELREVPGARKSYSDLSPEELKAAAKELREAGLKVSFINSGGTKFPLPGSEPLSAPRLKAGWQERAQKDFDGLSEQMRRHIRAALTFDCPKVRVFAFARVAEPEKLFPRIADVLGEMGEMARKEGVTLLVENEASCNVGTCAEFAALMKLLSEKSFGINWDANNGQTSKERPFPEGYALLPKKRIQNVHMHGRTLLDPEKILDWKSIFAQLGKDGYQGCAGLETHYFDGTKIEKSHLCMDELKRITARS